MAIKLLNKDAGTSAHAVIVEAAESFGNKKQAHELWVLTCYINFDLIVPLVKELLQHVRLTDVYLGFNYAEIYRDGPVETKQHLERIAVELRGLGVDVDCKALASARLVHSKGYAVVQKKREEIVDGVVLVTSANFTSAGFDGENIELGYVSTLKKDIREFEVVFDDLLDELERDVEESVIKENDYLFKYALLSSGVFLHKWSGSLRQHIGIRYQLTKDAKDKGSIAPELVRLGFEAGDTFTRSVIDLEDMPEKEISATFIKRFTIETYWGRWCPTQAWEYMGVEQNEENSCNQFVEAFRAATSDDLMERYLDEARNTQDELVSKNLIKKVDDGHLDRWVEKVKDLRESTQKLNRFFIGYEANQLPYTVEQKMEVEELYENLMEAISLAKSKNFVTKRLLDTVNSRDLSNLYLDEEQEEIIDEIRNEEEEG